LRRKLQSATDFADDRLSLGGLSMAADTVFEFVAEKLEQATDLDRLEARGTVRLALKQAGLDPKALSVEQMNVVLEKVLPDELSSRGIEQSTSICANLVQDLKGFRGAASDSDAASPEAVFKRIGGG
jgi:hypothetical protein